jgi:hypothetical protein
LIFILNSQGIEKSSAQIPSVFARMLTKCKKLWGISENILISKMPDMISLVMSDEYLLETG